MAFALPDAKIAPPQLPAIPRAAALCWLGVAALTGIALGRFGLAADLWLVGGCALIAMLLVRTRLALGGLLLLVLAVGLWRTTAWNAERAQLANLVGQRVTVAGTIADDPAISPNRQLDFKLTNLQLVDPATGERLEKLPGTLSIHTYSVQLQRGYQVQLDGKVKKGFGNAVAAMSFPSVKTLSREQDALEQWRQQFFAGMRTALPEPVASFGLGLLVGIRALIPKDMQAELALVGLSHLVAVSGYNLTIIVQAVDRALGRFGKGIALVSSLWLIGTFLIVTGASASIVRASLVSVLSLVAAFYGRRFQPLVLILVTAAATAMANPVYLTDLGWLLSYLAFFGILILAPAIETRLHHPKPLVARLFIESTAAQITTLPLILWMFGELSIVSPITNLIILPMIPLAMAVSFAAGLAGMFMPAFSGWLAWPAQLVLDFIVRLIDGFAALPWAGTHETLSLPGMLASYALIIALCVILARTNARAGRKHTPRASNFEVVKV